MAQMLHITLPIFLLKFQGFALSLELVSIFKNLTGKRYKQLRTLDTL